MIHEFDPQIYPCKLWVAITNKSDVLNERFKWDFNDSDVDIDFSNTDAITGAVRQRIDRKFGILIVFENKKVCTISNIAHESSHAADDIWKRLGEVNTGGEANAYLVGWIAKCIEKTLKNKRK